MKADIVCTDVSALWALVRKRFTLYSLQRKFTSVKCKTRPQFHLNSLYFILSSNHCTDLTLTIFKFKQAKYEQTRLNFLKALISGFIKLLSKRYELNLNSIVSVSIRKVDTVFYFYFGLRTHAQI